MPWDLAAANKGSPPAAAYPVFTEAADGMDEDEEGENFSGLGIEDQERLLLQLLQVGATAATAATGRSYILLLQLLQVGATSATAAAGRRRRERGGGREEERLL